MGKKGKKMAGYVKLPVDKNGKPVMVGDILVTEYEDEDLDTVTSEVIALIYSDRWDVQLSTDKEGEDSRDITELESFWNATRHATPEEEVVFYSQQIVDDLKTLAGSPFANMLAARSVSKLAERIEKRGGE